MRVSRAIPCVALMALLSVGCVSSGVEAPREAKAQEESRDHQIMVLLEPAPEPLWQRTLYELARDFELTAVAAWTMESIDAPCLIFEPRRAGDTEDLLRRIARDHRVQLAQTIQSFDTLGESATYNDPYHHLQHGVRTIRAAAAHEWATGRGVRIAVIDTGVEIGHPELVGRISLARNFVDQGGSSFTRDVHGTTVVGVIAAVGNNSTGIVGVAPEAEILALKACWPTGSSPGAARCNSYTLALAIDFALREEVDVVNLSIGGPEDPILGRLLTVAIERGTTVVAARPPDVESFPASLEGVVAVARAPGPGESPAPPGTLVAPGTDIITTVPQGSYDFVSGSSLAAAHVSGVAALLLELHPGLAAAEILRLLQESSAPTDADQRAERVDACAALASLRGDQCAGIEPALTTTAGGSR